MSYTKRMPSLFSPKPQFGIIFDIGPSSVGAGLARFKKSDVPQVIYSARESFPLREMVDAKRFFKDMLAALKRVNEKILKESAGMKISHVVYSLSSPWSSAQTKIVSVKKSKPFILDKKALARIIAEQTVILEKRGMGSALNLSEKLSVIEKRIVDIKLDGKVVAHPEEFKASKADISFFLSLTPKMVIDEITDSAMQTYEPKDTKVFSFPLVAYSMTRDLFHGVHDFISLVIGGEISDVSVVHDGLILETASFPFGSHFLVREVAKAFSASLGEAESILALYSKGHGTEVMTEKVEAVLAFAQNKFTDALNETVAGFSVNKPLPKNLFVTIDGSIADFFIKCLRANPKLDVTLLNPERLRDLVIFFPRVRKDPFIALITAFVNKSHALEVNKK